MTTIAVATITAASTTSGTAVECLLASRSAHARAPVWPSLEAVERAMTRLYPHVTVDLAGDKQAAVRVERQDLDEMLGNLIENAAKYGGGRVFVTVEPKSQTVDIDQPQKALVSED